MRGVLPFKKQRNVIGGNPRALFRLLDHGLFQVDQVEARLRIEMLPHLLFPIRRHVDFVGLFVGVSHVPFATAPDLGDLLPRFVVVELDIRSGQPIAVVQDLHAVGSGGEPRLPGRPIVIEIAHQRFEPVRLGNERDGLSVGVHLFEAEIGTERLRTARGRLRRGGRLFPGPVRRLLRVEEDPHAVVGGEEIRLGRRDPPAAAVEPGRLGLAADPHVALEGRVARRQDEGEAADALAVDGLRGPGPISPRDRGGRRNGGFARGQRLLERIAYERHVDVLQQLDAADSTNRNRIVRLGFFVPQEYERHPLRPAEMTIGAETEPVVRIDDVRVPFLEIKIAPVDAEVVGALDQHGSFEFRPHDGPRIAAEQADFMRKVITALSAQTL